MTNKKNILEQKDIDNWKTDENGIKTFPENSEFGNGETIYNLAREVRGDHEKIAHVAEDGTLTYYKKHLPDAVKAFEDEGYWNDEGTLYVLSEEKFIG